MNMLYRQRRKRHFSKRTLSASVIVLIFVVFLLTNATVPSGVVRLVHATGEPLWQTHPFVGTQVQGILKLFRSKGQLVAENQNLRTSHEKMKRVYIDYALLKEENERLVNLLSRVSDTGRIAAGVLLHPNISLYDTLVVDVGEENGIAVGNRVFASDRVYIGIVEEIYKKTSRVRLLSSPDYETNIILGESDVELTAVGNGGGNFILMVPRNISVSVGENIRLPGLSGGLVGRVSVIESRQADAFQTVYARLPINIYTLPDVFIEP